MAATRIEQAVVELMLRDASLSPLCSSVRWDAVKVKSRSMTGVGFLTEFNPSPELHVLGEDVSLRWGRAGARLNDAGVETGYVVYVNDGQVTGVEGYTYGDEWPTAIDRIDLFEAVPGTELKNRPRSSRVCDVAP